MEKAILIGFIVFTVILVIPTVFGMIKGPQPYSKERFERIRPYITVIFYVCVISSVIYILWLTKALPSSLAAQLSPILPLMCGVILGYIAQFPKSWAVKALIIIIPASIIFGLGRLMQFDSVEPIGFYIVGTVIGIIKLDFLSDRNEKEENK